MRPPKKNLATALVLALATLVVLASPIPSDAGKRRLRPPPDVSLHPDRGMPFGRLSKTSHDQRIFKPLNQGTRLVVMDPAVDPYNSVISGSVYDPQSGAVRGSLTDTVREMRRFEEASRQGRSKGTAGKSDSSPEKRSAKTDPSSQID